MDVAESIAYMFGEGLEKDVARIEEEYNDTLKLIGRHFPSIDFAKRYPFTEQMRKFSHHYLAHSLKPLAEVMASHQAQLQKAFELFKKNMKNKKELQSTYLIAKLAGSLLGGIPGSLGVSALFHGMNSNAEQQFIQELSLAHQTWYRIQTANLTETVTANYKPRLHHLCLSLIGGLWISIQKDLQVLGIEITDMDFTGSTITIELHEKGEEKFEWRMKQILKTSNDPNKVIDTIRTFSTFPQLASFTDTDNHLYIEKLYVHYLYLQAKELIETGKAVDLVQEIPSLNWVNERINSPFSFLEDDSYNEIFNTIHTAFFDFPDEMHRIYFEIIESNGLYSWSNTDKSRKILDWDYLAAFYIVSCILSKQMVPAYDIDEIQDFTESYLLPLLKEEPDSQIYFDIVDRWLPSDQSGNFITKWVGKLNNTNKLQQAIAALDYRMAEKLLRAGSQIKSLTITEEMVALKHRHFLNLITSMGKPTELKVEEDALLMVLENNDDIGLELLLKLGVNPFTPLDGTYLLARVTSRGNWIMAETIYQYCLSSFDQYKSSIMSLPDDQLTPYYFLYLSGKTYWPSKYPELINCIPADRREKELTMATASLTSRLLWEMFLTGYNDKFVSYARTREDSFFKTLCSTAHYLVVDEIHAFKPSLLASEIQGKPMLREVYELGHMDLAWHFHEILDIHDIGEVNYEDIERAVVAELNENFLILLNQSINGVDEALANIRQEAKEYGQTVIMELIDRVLRAS